MFIKCLLAAMFAMNIVQGVDYQGLVDKSLEFFNSMRSGDLTGETTENFVLSSGVNDGINDVSNYSVDDLSGGWFVNGGNVKFNFPMASTVTVLALAGIEHKEKLSNSGQFEKLLSTLRWPLEYMIKSHVDDGVLFMQCGDAVADLEDWERLAETVDPARECWKVDKNSVEQEQVSSTGSDIAGEFSAAFALSYLLFKDTDSEFADDLLEHAITLNAFAYEHQGTMNGAGQTTTEDSFFTSLRFEDELALSSLALHMAVNNYVAGEDFTAEDTTHLNKAEQVFLDSLYD